ncbi:MAG TPA: polysaccharide biosynthesis/export family protein [Terriglobales bacterium]|nr:polysaccharide biosynthesis/export family protein [Terriglobales bacterium]
MSRRFRRLCVWSLAPLVLSLAIPSLHAQTPVPGDVTAPSPPPGQTSQERSALSPPEASSTAKLGVGDLIEVSVYGVPDLNTKARVGSNGDVYLPLIDYVHVGDLTVEEAQELIQKRLSDGGFVRSPHVTIFVSESTSQAINVMGEVARPGPYSAIGDRRLFDVITAAGGLTDKAGRNVTIIHRENPDQRTELHLATNLGEDTQNNVPVLPGDTIIVSRAGIVYVVGAVGRPSGFLVEDNTLSVLKALALAGGGTRTASLNNAKILRQTPSGLQQIPVPLKKVLQAKAADVAMLKGDVLFVPSSTTKSVAFRSAEAAMSMTTALAVIAVHP